MKYELATRPDPVLFDTLRLDPRRTAHIEWFDLKKGGLLVFDDYTWMLPGEPDDRPGVAIESFMQTFKNKFDLIHIGWQVFLKKK